MIIDAARGSWEESISSPSTGDLKDGTENKAKVAQKCDKHKEEKELEQFKHWPTNNHQNFNERIPAVVLYSTSPCAKMLLEELISCLFCILSSSSWISFCLILILASITRCSSYNGIHELKKWSWINGLHS